MADGARRSKDAGCQAAPGPFPPPAGAGRRVQRVGVPLRHGRIWAPSPAASTPPALRRSAREGRRLPREEAGVPLSPHPLPCEGAGPFRYAKLWGPAQAASILPLRRALPRCAGAGVAHAMPVPPCEGSLHHYAGARASPTPRRSRPAKGPPLLRRGAGVHPGRADRPPREGGVEGGRRHVRGVHPALPRRTGEAAGQAGSASRAAIMARKAGRAWQAASQAATRGAAWNSAGAGWA